MKRRNNMKLSELVFEPNYSDGGSDLELVNEFFETNNEPTTTGREYKGCGGGYPCETYPHSFGLREQSDMYVGPYDVEKDDNKLLGWDSDRKDPNEWYGGSWSRLTTNSLEWMHKGDCDETN